MKKYSGWNPGFNSWHDFLTQRTTVRLIANIQTKSMFTFSKKVIYCAAEAFKKNNVKIIFFFFLLIFLCNFSSYCQTGNVQFKGDFNNGIIASKYTPNTWETYSPGAPIPGDHRWRLDSTIVHQGRYSMKVELRPGDTTNSQSDRAEIVNMQDSLGNKIIENGTVDSVKYYAFSIRLDTDWVSPAEGTVNGLGSHGIFFQLHKIMVNAANDTTGPAFAMQVTDKFYVTQHVGDFYYAADAKYDLSDNSLKKGTWIDFVVKLKFSIHNAGEIIVWRRNADQTLFTQVLHVININTLMYQVVKKVKEPLDHEWHTGYYRTRQLTNGQGVTNILWLDGFTVAKTAVPAQLNAFNSVVDLPGDGNICAPPIIADSVTNVACNGTATGSIYLSSYINISQNTIRWAGPNGFTSSLQNLKNIGIGTYTYHVTSPEGCTATKDIPITEPDPLLARVDYTKILCKGGSTTITISASGGVFPYKGTNTYTNKRAGDYSYVVSDKNRCTDTARVTITEPFLLKGTAVTDSSIKCFGGTTALTVSGNGGTLPYTRTGSFTVAVGQYTYPISDANGCKDTVNFVLKQQPNDLVLSKDVETMVSCKGGNDGSIRLVLNGGTGPYKYSFDGGSSYQKDSVKTGLPANHYAIAFIDANGCAKTPGTKIIVTEPALAVSSTVCYNKAASILHVVGTGGTPVYKYSLDHSDFDVSNNSDGGRDFSGIGAKTKQTVFLQDKNNCISSQTVNTVNLPSCNGFAKTTENSAVLPPHFHATVFPNPASAEFNLLIDKNSNAPIEITVCDMYAKIVYREAGSAKNYRFGGTLLPGVYIVKIVQGNFVQTIKIVKL